MHTLQTDLFLTVIVNKPQGCMHRFHNQEVREASTLPDFGPMCFRQPELFYSW